MWLTDWWAVVYQPNAKFYDAVLSAQRVAEVAGVGMFDPNAECTLPAQVANSLAQLEALTEPSAATAAAALAALATVTAAIEAAEAVEFVVDDALNGTHLVRRAAYAGSATGYRHTLQAALARAQAKEQRHTHHHASLVRSEEQARKAQEALKAEQARKAEETRKAEQARAVAAQKAEQERQAAAKKAQQPKQVQAPATKRPSAPKTTGKPTSKSTNPYPGYNGPRCYAPGGKTWKPC